MENKLKVLFLTKYSDKGASSRYRFYNYRKWFLENDVNPYYKPLFNDNYIESLYRRKTILKKIIGAVSLVRRVLFLFSSLSKYDHVVIEAELFPRLPLWLDLFFLKRMESFSLDFDDNISANYSGTPLRNKIPELIKKARFVTVGNHWYMSEYVGNLIYLPTVVDMERYPEYQKSSAEKVIVWIGSPSTVKYLHIIEDQLINLSKVHTFTLKVIGATVSLDSAIRTRFVKWDAATENRELSTGTVGIMPLMDTYWEKGKCGFKLIQYMASGIPVVASNLPANREIVVEGENGFIASSGDEWFKYLNLLLTDEKLAASLGANTRRRIEEYYSYQKWGKKYAEIIFENR